MQEINQSLGQTCNNDAKEIERLRKQLHTADQETLHFQNKYFAEKQIAIDELEKLLEKTKTLDVMVQSGHYINQKKVNVVFKDVIDQQIK